MMPRLPLKHGRIDTDFERNSELNDAEVIEEIVGSL